MKLDHRFLAIDEIKKKGSKSDITYLMYIEEGRPYYYEALRAGVDVRFS